MVKLPKFLQPSASERAGLTQPPQAQPRVNGADVATLTDQQLWEQFKGSQAAKQLVIDVEGTLLAKRAALMQELDAEIDAAQRRFREEAATRAAAAKRREKAEAELRAAIDFELRLGLPPCDLYPHRVGEIRRELEACADPRIGEFITWCQATHAACQLTDLPFIAPHFEPGQHGRRVSAGYDGEARAALLARMSALSAAVEEARELKLLPLTPAEVLTKLRKIHSTIPPLTADTSAERHPKPPAFLQMVSHP